MRTALLLAIAFLSASAPLYATAQQYPIKPIRLISPFAPGGGTDILARGIAVPVWYGIWGPRGTPAPIVARWNREVATVLRTDDLKNRARAEGLDPAGGPPEEFGKVIRRDIEKWRRVIRDAKIEREG